MSKRCVTGAAAVLGAIACALPATAGAATITPNTVNDDFTANGTCSLREAVSLANGDSTSFQGCTASADDDDDTIELASGQTYNLTLPGGDEDANAFGDLDILNESLTIESSGPNRATILADGNSTQDRVIDVDGPLGATGVASVTVNDVDISGGEDAAVAGGGAIRQASGALSVNRSRITGNSSDGGGAVMRLTSLTSTTSLLDTVITGNTGEGSAIFQETGSLAVVESAITGHNASGVFSGGGAIFKQSITTGTLTIWNSTISGNSVKTNGGALSIAGGGSTQVLNSTIANNTADSDAGGTAGDGGGIFVSAGTVDIANSIVADNVDGSPAPTDHDDCSGTFSSDGFNLIESTTGCAGLAGTDVTGQDPQLNPLSGGDHPVHSYPAGAPPDNSGDNVNLIGSGYPACLANDQRGFPRDGSVSRCDIGAYERQPPMLDPIGDRSVQAGQTLAFNATATPADPGDTLIFQSVNLPAGATFSPSGAFSWTPTEAQVGSFPNVTLQVADGSLADGEDITITVTAVPPPDPPATTPPPPTTKKKCKKGQKLKKVKGKTKCVKKKRKKGK